MSDPLIALVLSCLILTLMAAWVPFLHGCHRVTIKLRQPKSAAAEAESSPVLLRRGSQAL